MFFKVLFIQTWILVAAKEIYALNQPELCPDNAINSGEHVATHEKTCYLFINKEKFWDEARDYCWHMGGEMLMVDNIHTMQFIQRQLNSPKLGWRKNGVWVGASDLRDHGWEWTTGEKLRFSFWASGEPAKFLGLISLENCASMRRSDNWRWHDYHCHMSPFEYNFICQFPFVYRQHTDTDTLHHEDHGAPLKVTDDTAAMIGLVIGGVVLIAVMCSIIFYLHRKHQRQKALLKQSRPMIRYQNTGYATIIQQSREGSSSQLIPSTRPTSNIYLEPNEVTRIYDEVAKDNVNHGVNSLQSTGETTQLVYQGEAPSLENLDDNAYLTPTMSSTCISSATSGYCSTNNVANLDTGDYLEMTPPSGSGHLKNDLSANSSAANGDASDLGSYGVCQNGLKNGETANAFCQNGLKSNGLSQNGPKCSNLYVTTSAAATKFLNKSPDNEEKLDKSEMHIYTNQMENLDDTRMDNYSMRPLPPVPTNEKPTLTSESS